MERLWEIDRLRQRMRPVGAETFLTEFEVRAAKQFGAGSMSYKHRFIRK
jgi:hypothetical protein